LGRRQRSNRELAEKMVISPSNVPSEREYCGSVEENTKERRVLAPA
jgi:hypothetical protein